ncbi:MAG TPA: ribbon-helix-helix domain-containing protein [Thermoplasmata archaeon]|nr:ribbon-helix-helix domain-containing protein [Thermoplasmata archaeon]
MDEDENGRITLRLERENLALIDEFLEAHPAFRNRSQLCRDAVQSFIENVTQGGNTVAIKIPVRILEAIDHLVSDGYYNDREDAIVQALREHFNAAKLKEFQETKTELQKAKGEHIEVRMRGRDEVVSK